MRIIKHVCIRNTVMKKCFLLPFDSLKLNIVVVSDLREHLYEFDISDITSKIVLLPFLD